MNLSYRPSPLHAKLMDALLPLIDRHRAQLLPLVSRTGELSSSAMRSDETVRIVASYSYALLPGVLRLAVKEHVFVAIVMSNRDKILARLAPPGASGGSDA